MPELRKTSIGRQLRPFLFILLFLLFIFAKSFIVSDYNRKEKEREKKVGSAILKAVQKDIQTSLGKLYCEDQEMADLILRQSYIEDLRSMYFVSVFGAEGKKFLAGDEAQEQTTTICIKLNLNKGVFLLKLTPRETRTILNHIVNYGMGMGMLSVLGFLLMLLRQKNALLEESKQVIEEDKRKLHELAIKDPLTDIYNRRHFEKLLHSEFRRAKRYSFQLSCIMLDIDHFKQINDTYGHQFGDEVLKEVSGLLKNLTRDVDIAARYGGEEFIAILPETDVEGALTLAERIRSKLAEKQYVCRGKKLTITASLGVSTMKPDSEDIADEQKLVFQADQALYQAKGAGRNRVYRFAIKEVKCASASC